MRDVPVNVEKGEAALLAVSLWAQVSAPPELLPLVVIEYQGIDAPMQYDAGITALKIYLPHDQLSSEDCLVELMANLFGWKRTGGMKPGTHI